MFYDRINLNAGTYSPSPIRQHNNWSFGYWQRSLIQRALSVFEFKLPDTWRAQVKNFLEYRLIRWGYVEVFERPEYGFTFQPATINDFGWYYQPVHMTVSNKMLKESLIMEIGIDCEALRLTPDWFGIWDIICYYAEKLSGLDNSINTAIVNSKIAWILGAKNKSAAEAIKKALDKINKGEAAVILDSKLVNTSKKPTDTEEPWQLIDLEVKKNYILTDLLQDFQTLLNNFDAEIGIPSVPYAKKERMVSSEAESRIIDSRARCYVWLDCLKESMEIINKHFGSNLNVKFRYEQPEEESEVAENEQ